MSMRQMHFPSWDDKNIPPTSLFEVRLQKVWKLFNIPQPERVQHILRRYPSLVQILLDIHQHLMSYFPDPEVIIYASADPEFGGYPPDVKSEELAVSVMIGVEPKEAIKTLEKFYDDWWLLAYREASKQEAKGKISIGLELQ